MPIIKLQGGELNVDIADELSQYIWNRPRWTSDKLIAASPFRYDNTPSFFVNLDGEYAGAWGDSGAYDADYESGNFAKLLAFLRDETYEETYDYLFGLYGVRERNNTGNVSIRPVTINEEKRRVTLENGLLDEYMYRHPYLDKRGITGKVQRFMHVGYSRRDNAVTIPWRHADGTLANVKYRKAQGKAFWYVRGGAPIRSLVYGIDKVYRHDLQEVYICEAEIDAMSCYTAGVPAVAVGGASVSERQLEILRSSPIQRIVIATDNDKTGRKLRDQIAKGMRGYVTSIEALDWTSADSEGVKDVNDLIRSGGADIIKKTKPVNGSAFRINLS